MVRTNCRWQTVIPGILDGGRVRAQFAAQPDLNQSPQPGDVTAFNPSPGHQLSILEPDSPMNFDDPYASTSDLAIVPLDKRVPGVVATPAKLPFGPDPATLNKCPAKFTGTFFGFGGESLFGGKIRRVGTRTVFRNAVTNAAFGDVLVGQYTLESQVFDAFPSLATSSTSSLLPVPQAIPKR